MENKQLDRFITDALARSESEVPAEVRARIERRAAAGPRTSPLPWRRLVPWLPLLVAAVLIIVFSLPILVPRPAPEREITQIRTEFSLPDSNIRIVWVQRDDFRLPEGGG